MKLLTNSTAKGSQFNNWPWTEKVKKALYDTREVKQWPKISIVTPSYNQGQFIEETILSVISQNYPNLEYIIIDGGSTDDTVDIIKKYSQYITYWVSEPDKGQSHAINKGIERCTGEIFNWINSDDMLYFGALRKVGLLFQTENTHVIAGYRRRLLGEELLPLDEDIDRLKCFPAIEQTILTNHFIQSPTFFSLPIIKGMGGVSEKLCYVMDSELWLRYLLCHGQQSVIITNDWLATYRLHDKSKTVSQQEYFGKEIDQVYYSFYLKLGIQQEIADLLTPRKDVAFGFSYDITKIPLCKTRALVYKKAAKSYIPLRMTILFVRSLLLSFKNQGFSFRYAYQIVRFVLVPRITSMVYVKR